MNKDKSYSKQVLKHYFAKTVRSEITPWVVALSLFGGGASLSYQFNGGDPDRVGTVERDNFFTEIRKQEDSLLPRIDAFIEDRGEYNNAYRKLDNKIDSFDDRDLTQEEKKEKSVLIEKKDAMNFEAPEELKQDFQNFITTIYTESEGGEPVLSEKDMEVILGDINDYSFITINQLGGRDAVNIVKSQDSLEHFDGCFADYAPVNDDIRSRNYAASEIADCVDSRDVQGVWAFLGSSVAMLFLSLIAGTSLNEQGKGNAKLRNWAENKPKRPYNPSH